MVSDFEELIIYKQARELAKKIYQITREGEFKFDTRFVQQIRASAGSVVIILQKGLNVRVNENLFNSSI